MKNQPLTYPGLCCLSGPQEGAGWLPGADGKPSRRREKCWGVGVAMMILGSQSGKGQGIWTPPPCCTAHLPCPCMRCQVTGRARPQHTAAGTREASWPNLAPSTVWSFRDQETASPTVQDLPGSNLSPVRPEPLSSAPGSGQDCHCALSY